MNFSEINKIFIKLRPDELFFTKLHLALLKDFTEYRSLSFCTIEKYPQIYISPKLKNFPISNIKAVLMHELAHALYISKKKKHTEHQTDLLAAKTFGKKIYYDKNDVQTIRKTKQKKRPKHLHK